jgi:hypothetical protein
MVGFKMDLREISCECVNWIQLAHHRAQRHAFDNGGGGAGGEPSGYTTWESPD